MPFIQIHTPVKKDIDLKVLNQKVVENLPKIPNDISYYISNYDENNFHSISGKENILVVLSTSDSHPLEYSQQVLISAVTAVKEMYGIETVAGHINILPSGRLYIRGNFK